MPKPWTDLERYALIKSNKKDFPALAEIMGRTVEELQRQWDEFVKIQVDLWDEVIAKLMERGLTRVEALAFLRREEKVP